MWVTDCTVSNYFQFSYTKLLSFERNLIQIITSTVYSSNGPWERSAWSGMCELKFKHFLWILQVHKRVINESYKCQWLATGRWFSPVSSTNKTNRHVIAEILMNIALNTTTLTLLKWSLMHKAWLILYH
jgi:hypothetical protein